MKDGQDPKTGQFAKGNRLGGRPLGSRNKPYNGLILEARSAASRRFRDLFASIVGDLGGQGALSMGELQLARRCAMLSLECERMELAAVAGKDFDADLFGRLTDRLGRALDRLGLKRMPRDVTPTLETYLTGPQGAEEGR